MPKKVLIGYGIDVDAVSNWINTATGAPANPTDVSRGVFGATVGIERLLRLWDKYGIKTSWFVPAHSVESFPAQIGRVVERGHEMYVCFIFILGREGEGGVVYVCLGLWGVMVFCDSVSTFDVLFCGYGLL
jgi:hypothetical protein